MDNFIFYLIAQEQLAFPPGGMSLQNRRDRLRSALREYGAQWEIVRMRAADFFKAAEELGRVVGVKSDLVDFTFDSSPLDVLPPGRFNEYNAPFGYFDPERSKTYDSLLRAIKPQTLLELGAKDESEAIATALRAYSSVFAEAAIRGVAVAIDHS